MIDRSSIQLLPVKQPYLDEVAAIEGDNFPCPWKRDYFLHELYLPWRYSRIAVHNVEGPFKGHVIGYLFTHFVVPELHISKIATHRAFQRQGLAGIMMEDLFAFCDTKAIVEITLEVRISNIPAQQFYYRLGFKDEYVRKKYYPDGEDAMVMCLRRPAGGANGREAGKPESQKAEGGK